MIKISLTGAVLAVLLMGVAACGGNARPEPSVVVQEVYVTRAVPCAALAALGLEPAYPDTDEAIAGAPSIGALAPLYRIGRAMRSQRLLEYQTARSACAALEQE